jgi:hypothetical protein
MSVEMWARRERTAELRELDLLTATSEETVTWDSFLDAMDFVKAKRGLPSDIIQSIVEMFVPYRLMAVSVWNDKSYVLPIPNDHEHNEVIFKSMAGRLYNPDCRSKIDLFFSHILCDGEGNPVTFFRNGKWNLSSLDRDVWLSDGTEFCADFHYIKPDPSDLKELLWTMKLKLEDKDVDVKQVKSHASLLLRVGKRLGLKHF